MLSLLVNSGGVSTYLMTKRSKSGSSAGSGAGAGASSSSTSSPAPILTKPSAKLPTVGKRKLSAPSAAQPVVAVASDSIIGGSAGAGADAGAVVTSIAAPVIPFVSTPPPAFRWNEIDIDTEPEN